MLLPETANEDAVGTFLENVDMVFIPTAGRASTRRTEWERRLRRLADDMRIPDYAASRVAEFSSGAKPGKALRRQRRYGLVAVPDYCFTNGVSVIKANMVESLVKAGFFPYVIPFTADDKALAGYIRPADALLVAGGFRLQDYNKRCDFEIRAIRIALDHAMRIAAVLGAGTVVINSSHSRCIGKPAPGMKVTARAPDGVIEAIEHETLPVMAFQFHPERMAFDERMVKLIRTALSPRR